MRGPVSRSEALPGRLNQSEAWSVYLDQSEALSGGLDQSDASNAWSVYLDVPGEAGQAVSALVEAAQDGGGVRDGAGLALLDYYYLYHYLII